MDKTITIDNLIKKMSEVVESKRELDDILNAYNFALEHHKGKKRLSGEDYIMHPLSVAFIVADLNVDSKTIIGAILHETLNHGGANYQEICDLFGSEVANIVLSISKINKLELTDDSESSSIYLRKILVGLSEDVRVLFIKLADRLHNMRTIEALPVEEQKKKANETMKVLVPIAHRLGINRIKSELEDLCLRYLKPNVYHDIEEELNNTRGEMTEVLNEMKDNISTILSDYGLKFEIKGRVKSINSIYEKLAKGRKFNDIYDILALRVILPKESDCYLAVGLIHAKYRPIPKRFKDYIAMPKENMYQSLHTTVFGIDGYLFEIQLRTYEMDEIAEKGIASHWSYKESGTQRIQNIMEQKLELFRNIIETNNEGLSDEEFAQNVTSEFINDLIYVYTPKGDVVELPKEATPIDFAYRIHSNVGDTTVGALVNDIIVPLDHPLQDGDIVKIRTDKNSYPKKEWIKLCKTSQAKDKIKAYFSKQDRNTYIEKGKLLLDKEIKKRKLPNNEVLNDDNLNKIFKSLKFKDIDDMYLAIGTMRYLPGYIIDFNSDNKEKDFLINKRNKVISTKEKPYTGDIIVCGCDDIKITIANCCKPVKGDDIVGYITKGNGVSVHQKNCPNIGDNNERLIEVSWNMNNSNYYFTDILIETDSLSDHLMDIISKTGQKDLFIESIDKKEIENGINYKLTIKIKTIKDLESFMNDLKQLSYIRNVGRINR